MLGPEEKSGLVIRSIAGKTDIYLNGVGPVKIYAQIYLQAPAE